MSILEKCSINDLQNEWLIRFNPTKEQIIVILQSLRASFFRYPENNITNYLASSALFIFRGLSSLCASFSFSSAFCQQTMVWQVWLNSITHYTVSPSSWTWPIWTAAMLLAFLCLSCSSNVQCRFKTAPETSMLRFQEKVQTLNAL